MKHLLPLLALTSIILWGGCKKDTLFNGKSLNTYQANKTAQDEEDYYDDIVTTAAYGLLEISQQSNFRRLVHDLILLQFDGDDNTLLLHVNGQVNQTAVLGNDGLAGKMADFINSNMPVLNGTYTMTDHIDSAINGFSYFGDEVYTQIYIPFIDNFIENLNQDPIIVINLNDDAILPGMRIEDGELTFYNVDESFAETNLVWVISVNERVENLDTLAKFKPSCHYEDAGKYIRLSNIKVSDKKESWANGRAEIGFFGFQYELCETNPIRTVDFYQSI